MTPRRRPRLPREDDFSSPLHDPRVTARVGVWLGVAFATCFVTGLVSHWAYLSDPLVPFPTRPVWGYRLTQGLHVVSGVAAVPLLLVKLWSVQPRLWRRPPGARERGHLLRHLLERASVGVLVASAVFLLASGLVNTAQWYPFDFSFRPTHHAVAWVAAGSVVLHLAVKLPTIRAGLAGRVVDPGVPADPGGPADPADRPSPGGPARRSLLRATGAATGVAALAVAGQAVPGLRRVSVLGTTDGDGPQGLPVNTTAADAGVVALATAPGWVLEVVHGDRVRRLGADDLADLEQRTETLPIACVEGWSASGSWSGARLSDVLALVGAPARSEVAVTSLQPDGPFRTSVLPPHFAADERTLLALRLEGETLALDHGFPCRLVAPNRPGVLQTKWLRRLEVRA